MKEKFFHFFLPKILQVLILNKVMLSNFFLWKMRFTMNNYHAVMKWVNFPRLIAGVLRILIMITG